MRQPIVSRFTERQPGARDERSGRRGFTLLEVLIYSGILFLITAPITLVVLASIRSNLEHDAVGRVAERNRVALSRIAEDLRPALESTVSVSGDARSLFLTLPNGYDGAAIVPGDRIEFRLDLVPGETENGSDDNGNGLVDEGQLVRKNLSRGEDIVICQGIDLSESRFEQPGGEVVITMANSGKLPNGDTVHTLSRTVTVAPRN